VLVAEEKRLLGVISSLDLVRLLANGRLVESSVR
jgi:CBS domain-containing protein